MVRPSERSIQLPSIITEWVSLDSLWFAGGCGQSPWCYAGFNYWLTQINGVSKNPFSPGSAAVFTVTGKSYTRWPMANILPSFRRRPSVHIVLHLTRAMTKWPSSWSCHARCYPFTIYWNICGPSQRYFYSEIGNAMIPEWTEAKLRPPDDQPVTIGIQCQRQKIQLETFQELSWHFIAPIPFTKRRLLGGHNQHTEGLFAYRKTLCVPHTPRHCPRIFFLRPVIGQGFP